MRSTRDFPQTTIRDTSADPGQIFPGFKGFQAFCNGLVLDSGQRMTLEPFQLKIVGPYFRGVREVVAILPAGNAKSTLLAALGLFHMLTTPRAECIVAAAAADQAGIIFDQMAGLVETSGLPLDVKRGIRAIYHKGQGPNRKPLGRVRVISADVNRNSGAIPTLVLIDELQAHKDGHLYNMFQMRLNKRGAQMVTISNAGWDEESFLAQIRQRAHKHESFSRKGKLNHARMGPLEFFEWCLGPKDDPRHLPTVKKANPLRHVKVEDLKLRLESSALIWPEWLRATCGLWTLAETPWIRPEDWDPLKVDIGGLQRGDQVYVGIRVGSGVGIGIASPREDERMAVGIRHIAVPESGRVPFRQIETELAELMDRYDVMEIDYDPGQFGGASDVLEESGFPMQRIDQTPTRLALATATFWRLVSNGLLMHDGDEELRHQVLAGSTKESVRGWRIDPTSNTRALVALIVACHEAAKTFPDPLVIVPSVVA